MKQPLPFAAKWKIAENDLIALKDFSNGCLQSTYVTTLSGIQYRLQIYPNGNRKENHGKVSVFLVVKIGSFKEVKATCTINVESANDFSREIAHNFKESGGWGKCFCSTAELFNAQKEFIRDGKFELKVIGVFEYEDGKKTKMVMNLRLGNDLWANEGSEDFKIFADGKVIKVCLIYCSTNVLRLYHFLVHKLVLASASPVFDEMFKSESKEALENQLVISEFPFNTVEWALKEIYDCTLPVTDTDINSLIKFFDKFNMPFFKDKYVNLLLQHDGIREIKNNDSNNVCRIKNPNPVGKKLYEKNDSKDYTIVVDGKAIMVHKFILAARSSTFAEMFRSKSAEPAKNQTEICDFSFDIVKEAIKAIYQIIDIRTYNLHDSLLVLQFLYKYNFVSTKDGAEEIATLWVCAATVCHFINNALNSNSTKLHAKCMEFLMSAYASNTPLFDIANLDKNVALKIIQNAGHRVTDKDTALKIFQEFTCQTVYTRKENDSSSMMPASK